MDDKQTFLKLYCDGFKNDGKYVDYFFANVYDAKNAMLNSAKTSALHVIYKPLAFNNKVLKLPFLVAVSTHTSKRGTGEIRQLLQECLLRMRKENMPFVGLYPFRHDYYKQYGFVTVDRQYKLNSTDFCAIKIPLTQKLIDDNIDAYYNLYTDFCRVFDVYLARSKQDMALKFKGLLCDESQIIHYIQDGEIIAYELYSNGELEDVGAKSTVPICLQADENAQCRVADIKSALELACYNVLELNLDFKVIDDMLGDSVWNLKIKDGVVTATKLNDNAICNLKFSAQDLTTALFGVSQEKLCALARYVKPNKVFLIDKY